MNEYLTGSLSCWKIVLPELWNVQLLQSNCGPTSLINSLLAWALRLGGCPCLGDIHMCRALIIISIILAFFGSILVLVGMKCTKIGGSEITNAKVTFAGGMNYLIGGMCAMVAFSYYANKIRSEFHDPYYNEQKFEIGVGVFIGWGGSTLLVSGGLIYSVLAGGEAFNSKPEKYSTTRYPDYTFVPSRRSYASSARTEITGTRKSRSSSRSSISVISSTSKHTPSNAYV
ncbi:hypothetical protein ILYODFUR_030528 [Ilyodon furcidens]|uniref:Uncharacterized protein n=1 Tax=Ilyodon furcidens TaxID=33524 RepID=A0ABV0T5A0_9TELE